MAASPSISISSSQHLRELPTGRINACKSCYKNKEKCTYIDIGRGCCRCINLGRECVARPKKRIGRRPGTANFSHGKCSVLEFGPGKPSNHRSHSDSDDQSSCGTPSSTCSTDVSRLKPRPPSEHVGNHGSINRSTAAWAPHELPTLGLSRLDRMLSTKEGFFEAHRYFMLGRSFSHQFQSTVCMLYAHAPKFLGPAYSTTLELLSSRGSQLKTHDDFSLTLGRLGLRHLSDGQSTVTDVKGAAATLLLGQVLLVYNSLVTCPSARVITRAAILCAKDWYPALLQNPDLDSVTLTSVVADTVECLFRREKPVLRFPDINRQVIDRFIGVCYPLVQFFYDLCDKSYDVKTCHPDLLFASDQTDPYTEIERKIRAWSPVTPPNFFTEYDSQETYTILAQARLFRLAALLIIHRLRFPLGVEDQIGTCYAENILNELSILASRPNDGATGFGRDFPLLVAFIELPGAGLEALKATERFRFRWQHTDEICAFVKSVGKAYEEGYNGLWIDLLEGQLPNILFP